MAEYHHHGDDPTRFSMQNFVVQTQTVRLDVSELSTGVLLDSHDPPLEDCDSEGNLPRRLFPEGSDGASQAGGNSITPTQVTIDSSVAVGTHYVNSGLATDQETAPDRVNGMAVNHGNEENVDVDAFLETALNARSTQRIRFKYSRMYFYGTSDMYLKIDPSKPGPDSTPELVGQVVACPCQKNNRQFEINWIRPRTVTDMPPNLSDHLRRFFPRDLVFLQLQSLISNCELNLFLTTDRPQRQRPVVPLPQLAPNPPSLVPQPTSVTVTTDHQQPPNEERMIDQEAVGVMPVPATTPRTVPTHDSFQTPSISQRQAFASMHTMGSVPTTNSSGSGSNERNVRGRVTAARTVVTRRRSQNDDDYDSDDYDTDGEDRYDVDFTENFWQQRSQIQDMVNEGDDDEEVPEEDEETRIVFPDELHRHQDLSNFLEQCTDFEFIELTSEEAAAMPPPQKIYDGETGLQDICHISH